METYDIKVFKYNDSEESVREQKEPTIFLAGPTVRGNQPHLTSWRFEAVELFKEKKFNGALVIPEFPSKTESDQNKDWVPMWEYNGLKRADCIMFWIPRTKDQLVDGKIVTGLIALTTNWEMGYWAAKALPKVIYGRPTGSFRNSYPDIMWNKIHAEIAEEHLKVNPNFQAGSYKTKIYTTLSEIIDASIKNAEFIHQLRLMTDNQFF